LHIDNQYCRKAAQTLKRYALPQLADLGLSPMNACLHPDSRPDSQSENVRLWQPNAMMLSAGILFLLGLAINASSIRGVQENFLQLAEVSAEIRTLAAHSNQLAGSMQFHPRGGEMTLPDSPASPDRLTASVEEQLEKTTPRRPVQTDKAGPDPGIMEQPPSAAAPRSAQIEREAGNSRAYGKWGPPLLLHVAQAAGPAGLHGSNPYGEEIRDNLRALGFDVPKEYPNGRTGTRTL